MFRRKKNAGSEKSYKTGRYGPRYLAGFKKTKRTLPEDHSITNPPPKDQVERVQKLLETIITEAQKFEQYKEIRDEHILLSIKELSNMRFSIIVNKGEVELIPNGSKDDPSIVLNVSIRNLEGLIEFLEDKVIDRRELFILARFFAIPILKDLYDQKILYVPGNKWKFKYDDFIQIEILPDEPVIEKGEVLDIKITVVNVDGQWLVFKGWEGDPDWRLTLDLDTALELWWMGTQEARKHSKNPVKLLSLSKEFLKILDENVTYLRSDHEREFVKDMPELDVEDETEELEEEISE